MPRAVFVWRCAKQSSRAWQAPYVARMAVPVLRHRLLRSFEAETDRRSVDDIVQEVLDQVPVDADRAVPVRLMPDAITGGDAR